MPIIILLYLACGYAVFCHSVNEGYDEHGDYYSLFIITIAWPVFLLMFLCWEIDDWIHKNDGENE